MKKQLLIILITLIIIIPISAGAYGIIKNKKEKIQIENNLAKAQEENNQIAVELYNIYETEEVEAYVNTVNQKVNTILEKEQITTTDQLTLKNTFITLTDFIFYGTEINGVTFEQLTLAAQEQLLILYDEIDKKIEEKCPGYKETIRTNSEKRYNEIRTQLETLKEEVENSYKEQIGEEEYARRKAKVAENIQIIEDSFEPVVDTAKENAHEIYEVTKESFHNWYQAWKEANS